MSEANVCFIVRLDELSASASQEKYNEDLQVVLNANWWNVWEFKTVSIKSGINFITFSYTY